MNIITEIFVKFAATCQPGSDFFGFPTWYKYLDGQDAGGGRECSPTLTGVGDLWLIVLAIIEILLRIAIIVAIVFVLYGGFRYITARGNPDKITSARITIQDALIGLVIAVVATAMVAFIATRIS